LNVQALDKLLMDADFELFELFVALGARSFGRLGCSRRRWRRGGGRTRWFEHGDGGFAFCK
jgi:hypothetical protein